MADNFLSYNRFTTLPPNISQFGATVEELDLQKGKPDPNPVLSPMPEVRVPEARLGLSRGGSDRLRVAMGTAPEVNPYEGPKSNLHHSRNVQKKLESPVMAYIGSIIDNDPTIDRDKQPLMKDSVGRIKSLCQRLAYRNQLTETLYAKALSASKG